jgi:uncharacterized SAM-binding protein YcdF (DUF218 family)
MARRNFFRITALIAMLGVCAGGTIAFRGAGRWLVREDALGPADAIMVLSGSMPARAQEAARIFRLGYAREVWVSRPESPATTLEQMGIQYRGEEDYNREVLIHDGVPEANVRIIASAIINTEQEVASEMRKEHMARVIIVTSPQHTRRVRTLWRKLVGENPQAIVRGAPQDAFDADHWWRDTRDTYSVVREMMGLLNAWTGLRVRPHSD